MILGIESSCDESALALLTLDGKLAWECVHTQATHVKHGGVVPELAVREHLKKLPELMTEIPVKMTEITKVAVTVGPGLVGSLAMGMAQAKAIGVQYGIPVVGVNHLRAHAWSVFVGKTQEEIKALLPHLGLLVSGGNTILYVINEAMELKVLAKTRDDAAGECLDKGAKMLGLPYPGGPLIEKLASEGNANAFSFPIAFKESGELGFSFSGLKTALRYKLQAMSAEDVEAKKKDLAASYQKAVVESLLLMTRRAIKHEVYKSVGVCGGVANNNLLRAELEKLAEENEMVFLAAEKKHCGDNAGMIAWAAWVDAGGLKSPEAFLPALGIA